MVHDTKSKCEVTKSAFPYLSEQKSLWFEQFDKPRTVQPLRLLSCSVLPAEEACGEGVTGCDDSRCLSSISGDRTSTWRNGSVVVTDADFSLSECRLWMEDDGRKQCSCCDSDPFCANASTVEVGYEVGIAAGSSMCRPETITDDPRPATWYNIYG